MTSPQKNSLHRIYSIHLRYFFAVNLWFQVFVYGIAVSLAFGILNALTYNVDAIMVLTQKNATNKANLDWMEYYQVGLHSIFGHEPNIT